MSVPKNAIARGSFAVSAAALLSVGGVAHAQEAATTVAQASESQASAPTIEEVVVTAQRRQENEREVPLSITTLSEDQLTQEGVTSTQDLTQVIPGLKMDRVGGFTEPAIRGVSTQLTNAGTDANVAIYLDGVYQPSQGANTFDLPDITRVEVDKGPQGTLFGRNAVGGAIQIFTKEPSFTPNGEISATYGSFNERGFDGYFSGPILDNILAGSLSAYYDRNDGYYRDLLDGATVGGKQEYNFRGKLKAQFSDNAQVTFTGFYSRDNDSSSIFGDALNGNTSAKGAPGAVIPTQPFTTAYNLNPDGHVPTNDVLNYGGSIRGTLDESYGTYTTTLSGTQIYGRVFLDADTAYTPAGGPFYTQLTDEKSYTGELNFASKQFGPFSFITGLFAYYDRAAYTPLLVSQDLLIPSAATYAVSIFGAQNDKSFAGYFEGTYHITDQLSAVAGVRYSYEYRELTGDAAFGDVVNPPGPLYKYDDHTWHATTPRFSLRYAIDPVTDVYATYSQGFKSGAYNPTSIPFAPPPAAAEAPVNPETLDAYEVGFKTLLASRLSIDSSVYYYNYRNEQVNSFAYVNGVPISVLTNAASSRIYGADLEATMAWSNEFSTRAGLSYLHARYNEYPNAVLDVPVAGGGNAALTENASGNTMIRSPDWTLTVDADWHRQFTQGMLTVNANLYHSDRFFYEVGDRISQPQYTTLGVRAGWKFADSGFSVEAWGKNLTNATIIEGAFITQNSDALSYMPPRSGGVTLRYVF